MAPHGPALAPFALNRPPVPAEEVRLGGRLHTKRRDSHEQMAEIFNSFDRQTEARFITALEERNREAAERITAALWRTMYDPSSGLLWISTNDPGAAGVFARREQPFAANVLVARALAALSRAAGVPEPSRRLYRQRALGLLAALATPERLSAQGRILGEYLLALDEAGALRWAR